MQVWTRHPGRGAWKHSCAGTCLQSRSPRFVPRLGLLHSLRCRVVSSSAVETNVTNGKTWNPFHSWKTSQSPEHLPVTLEATKGHVGANGGWRPYSQSVIGTNGS